MYRWSFSQARDLSLNDLRMALLNFISAKQANEPFIVRVDDADKGQVAEDKERDSLGTLALFGISYSQLYYQSRNFKYHLQFASTLLDQRKAFICFCPENKTPYDGTCENLSSEEVLNNPNPFVLRMKKRTKDEDSFVIMTTDKYPSSLFARACDDMLQGVTTIIDEETHRSDASKEEWIRTSLGYDQAMRYVYVPAFQDAKQSVQGLLDDGFMPEAIANYLLMPNRILTLEAMIATCDPQSDLLTSFEMETLRAINREHIQKLDDSQHVKKYPKEIVK
ncbi:glutamate--tRNA ligase family protein [Sulfurospirillum cavolei]|uniref:glutamate--tRNA ligase family protein n=1 Tax=Sulfurospirillum cavolei TaxID=366522 RepID=UPI003FA29446